MLYICVPQCNICHGMFPQYCYVSMLCFSSDTLNVSRRWIAVFWRTGVVRSWRVYTSCIPARPLSSTETWNVTTYSSQALLDQWRSVIWVSLHSRTSRLLKVLLVSSSSIWLILINLQSILWWKNDCWMSIYYLCVYRIVLEFFQYFMFSSRFMLFPT